MSVDATTVAAADPSPDPAPPPCPDLETYLAHRDEHYRRGDRWGCRACEPPDATRPHSTQRHGHQQRRIAAPNASLGRLGYRWTADISARPQGGRFVGPAPFLPDRSPPPHTRLGYPVLVIEHEPDGHQARMTPPKRPETGPKSIQKTRFSRRLLRPADRIRPVAQLPVWAPPLLPQRLAIPATPPGQRSTTGHRAARGIDPRRRSEDAGGVRRR
jgi:hypothetical protein